MPRVGDGMSEADGQYAAAFGYLDSHTRLVDGAMRLHIDVIEPWQCLMQAAQDAGFQLTLASAYRSFDRQQLIWNAKLSGKRPILDDNGCELDIQCLSALEKVERVLRWSALPGASRHHWGTDMDIYDKAAISDDYQLQLTPDEYMGGGPFAPMITWLQEYLRDPAAPAFFFPYIEDNNGVMPEPWHLSYRPVAERYEQQWSLKHLANHLGQCDVLEKDTVLQHLDELYERFILDSINPKT